jgi:acyl carrier protein
MEAIKQLIKEFILENFLFGADGNSINYDDSFLEKGIVDSTGVLELVSFIEEKYGISVDDDELVPENLDSINNLARFVHEKRDK